MVDCSRPATKSFEHWPYSDMAIINANHAAFDVNKMCGDRGCPDLNMIERRAWRADAQATARSRFRR